jgi:tRNA threonylcarbamoyladenosine biosynthesis protein TsaB
MKGVLLAVDTSTRCIGLALYDGLQVLYEAAWTSPEAHTVELAPAAATALRQCGLTTMDLGAVAAALGPGSFTGLRIGLAFAKGLVLARGLPLFGIPTLDALAAAMPVTAGERLAAVLRAGRGRLAVGWYEAGLQGWRSAAPVEALTPEQLAAKVETPTQICGELGQEERAALEAFALPDGLPKSGAKSLLRLASPAASLRRPGHLAELAWKRWQSGMPDDPAALSPIYLHYNEPIPG